MPYTAKKTTVVPAMDVNWNAPVWANAETAELTFLRRESSDHCPKVQVRLLHDDNAVYGIYHVEDRYVIAVKEGYQQQVLIRFMRQLMPLLRTMQCVFRQVFLTR